MRSWTSFRVDSETVAEVFAGNCIGMYRDCGVSVPSRRLVAFNTESPPWWDASRAFYLYFASVWPSVANM